MRDHKIKAPKIGSQKFAQIRVSNSWEIVDMDKYCQTPNLT